ncbi:MAG: hypothetical protein GX073_04485 [Firmicutes bacterium]|nr:hypothetical protein [Bacillota bacterium]
MTPSRLTSKKWRTMVVLGLSILLVAVPALGQSRVYSDVPDWAYQAVKKLVENGYLELYDDGTFRGNNPVDRYTFAMVVAQLLTDFGEGGARGGQDDVALLRKLSNEFQNELVLLALKDKELEARLVQLEQGRIILAEDQTKNTAEVQALNAELNALRKQVTQLIEEKNRLAAQLSAVETQQEEQQMAMENLQTELEKERRTNRVILIVLGLVGVAGLFLPAQ